MLAFLTLIYFHWPMPVDRPKSPIIAAFDPSIIVDFFIQGWIERQTIQQFHIVQVEETVLQEWHLLTCFWKAVCSTSLMRYWRASSCSLRTWSYSVIRRKKCCFAIYCLWQFWTLADANHFYATNDITDVNKNKSKIGKLIIKIKIKIKIQTLRLCRSVAVADIGRNVDMVTDWNDCLIDWLIWMFDWFIDD